MMILPLIVALLQTPPPQVGSTLAVTVTSPRNLDCQGRDVEQWLLTYGPPPCYQPDGIAAGSPFIVAVRIRVTPWTTAEQPNPVASVHDVPRDRVFRSDSPTVCAPTPAPCLSVRVPAVAGWQNVEWAFVDGEGRPSDWSIALAALGQGTTPANSQDGRVRP
jgi:hypothetical protein